VRVRNDAQGLRDRTLGWRTWRGARGGAAGAERPLLGGSPVWRRGGGVGGGLIMGWCECRVVRRVTEAAPLRRVTQRRGLGKHSRAAARTWAPNPVHATEVDTAPTPSRRRRGLAGLGQRALPQGLARSVHAARNRRRPSPTPTPGRRQRRARGEGARRVGQLGREDRREPSTG
jgi:hypothetical protein